VNDIGPAAVSLAAGASDALTNGCTTKLMTMAEFALAMKRAGEIRAAYTPPQA